MQSTTARINPAGPAWLKTLIGGALFVGFGIALHGILLSVEYRWTKVLDVHALAGRDAGYRMVLIETPERLRVIRTSEHVIRIQKGAQICVSRKRMIAKRWLRYDVAFPGYCRNQPRGLPPQSTFVIE